MMNKEEKALCKQRLNHFLQKTKGVREEGLNHKAYLGCSDGIVCVETFEESGKISVWQIDNDDGDEYKLVDIADGIRNKWAVKIIMSCLAD